MTSNVRGDPVGDLIPGWVNVCREAHKSRVQLWRDIRAGTFPAPLELGPNRVAWVRAEVEAWKGSRPRRTYGGPETPTLHATASTNPTGALEKARISKLEKTVGIDGKAKPAPRETDAHAKATPATVSRVRP